MPMAFLRGGTSKPQVQMIQLTKLNNQPFAVNADLIKFVEQAPDTVLTLISGEKIVVRENAEEVIRRIIEFRRIVLGGIAGNPYAGSNESNRG
jgi:flagellar protein FlbD